MNDDTLRTAAEPAMGEVGERPVDLNREAVEWAWAQPITNNPGARIVLMCLGRRVGDTWECIASQGEIAADALLSTRSVRRHMEQLEEGEYIRRQKRFDDNGHRLPDLCRLNPSLALPANLASRQVSPVANLADGDSDPVAKLDGRQVSPVANLASGQSDLWPDWPVVDPSETDIPRSEPVANLTSGQIGRAISTSPTEKYQENNPSSSSKKQRTKTKRSADAPLRDDVEQLCNRLLQWLIKKDYRQRPPSVPDGWRDAARKLLDIDKIPLQEAINVLNWSQKDFFWRNNVHSMVKFRDKYGDLEMKSRGLRDDGQSAQVHQLRPTGTGDSRFTPGSGARLDRNITYSDDPKDVFGS